MLSLPDEAGADGTWGLRFLRGLGRRRPGGLHRLEVRGRRRWRATAIVRVLLPDFAGVATPLDIATMVAGGRAPLRWVRRRRPGLPTLLVVRHPLPWQVVLLRRWKRR